MASNHAAMFISKALDGENHKAFSQFGIGLEMFLSKSDKEAYDFIEQYRKQNGEEMPSYAVVTDAVDGFNYVPGVTDSFEYLAKNIRTRKTQVEFNEYMTSKETNDFINDNKEDMAKVISKLTSDLSYLNIRYNPTEHTFGMDMKADIDSFLSEYEDRQEGISYKTWESSFPYLNKETGGYSSGNMYAIFGRSGRGKSAILLREVLEMAQQGAKVLLYSLEMTNYEVLTRLYVMLSAKLGKTNISMETEFGNETMEAGFHSGSVRDGKMSEEHEKSFREMLETINEHVKGTVIIRGVDDENFEDRSADQFRRDLEATGADVGCIDPIYLMDFEQNRSKVAGGDVAETSKKIRRIAGITKVPIIVMTQSDEETTEAGEGEGRELSIPKRSQVKKTKQILEDSSVLLAIDTNYLQGRGVISIAKGRHGGESTSCELTFLPNYGLIKELQIDPNEFNF